MQISVIIPAAGSSTRFNKCDHDPLAALGQPRSKLDEDLGGKSVLQRTVELFSTRDDVHQIIVAGPHDQSAYQSFRDQHADRLVLLGATIVQGGPDERWQTVQAALSSVNDQCTHVAIHDAARPATKPELIDQIFNAAKSHGAVIPGTKVSDTLKRVHHDPIKSDQDIDPINAILGDESNSSMFKVHEPIDRNHAMAIQTPQIFERELLIRAYAQEDLSSTDDAGLIERLGEPVIVIEGDPTNMKLTHANELPLLRAIMNVKPPQSKPAHKRF